MEDRRRSPLAYTYTGSDEFQTITNNSALLAGYTYDAAGNRLTRSLANSTVAKYTYDADNRLTGIQELQGSTSERNNTYTYDVERRITLRPPAVSQRIFTITAGVQSFG